MEGSEDRQLLAVHETLAEMSRIKYETGKFPEHMGERIISCRGEDKPKPSKAQMEENAKQWRDLYRTVEKVYKEREMIEQGTSIRRPACGLREREARTRGQRPVGLVKVNFTDDEGGMAFLRVVTKNGE